jgi:hypothetical protein
MMVWGCMGWNGVVFSVRWREWSMQSSTSLS